MDPKMLQSNPYDLEKITLLVILRIDMRSGDCTLDEVLNNTELLN